MGPLKCLLNNSLRVQRFFQSSTPLLIDYKAERIELTLGTDDDEEIRLAHISNR